MGFQKKKEKKQNSFNSGEGEVGCEEEWRRRSPAVKKLGGEEKAVLSN